MLSRNDKQSGAVSLFVVVFASLIITVLTVSFSRIMVSEQQKAVDDDLSRSAYDSAQAGVEDAKRAILRYHLLCDGNNTSQCTSQFKSYFTSSSKCNDAIKTLTDITGSGASSAAEVRVQTGTNNTLNQAYTCVKVSMTTPDYLGSLSANESTFIPLFATNQFRKVRIQWFSQKDISSEFNSLTNITTLNNILLYSGWQANRPSVMRAQIIKIGSSFRPSDFDYNNSTNTYTYTHFLYPYRTSTNATTLLNSKNVTLDTRKVYSSATGTSSVRALPIYCRTSVSTGNYACTVTLVLPAYVSTSDRAFLRLTSLYNKANFKVTLLDGTNPGNVVNFNSVQPEIDATGRANDLFRRVKARVELSDVNFPYPEAAVDVTGGFCKNFWVTSNPSDYNDNASGISGGCNP